MAETSPGPLFIEEPTIGGWFDGSEIPSTTKTIAYIAEKTFERNIPKDQVEFVLGRTAEVLTQMEEISKYLMKLIGEGEEFASAATKTFEKFKDVSREEFFNIMTILEDMAGRNGYLKETIDKGTLHICKSLNTFTATAGVTSGVYSVSCLVRTKNPLARWFYITGLSCSGVGTTLSAVAALGQPPGCCSYSC